MKLMPLLGYTLLSSSLVLSGCGDDNSDKSSEKSAVATTARASALVEVDEECIGGGILLETGVDTNTDGVLQDAEVSRSQKICNGLDGLQGLNGQDGNNGLDGFNTLISQSPETNRVLCANGGVRFEVGLDINKSGVLDFNEVNATSWVCNGSDGQAGADGVDGAYAGAGFDALIQSSPVGAGEVCVYAGEKFETGLDINRNQVLDVDEITGTGLVCNGMAGTNGIDGFTSLVNYSEIAAGNICSAGGIKFETGLDTNSNSVLDENELTGNKTLCHGEQGGAGLDGDNGVSALINYTEAEESTCASGGYTIDMGHDFNQNQVLDASEIMDTGTVCNGDNGQDGSNGLNALVIQSVEGIGQHCASGGVRFDAGIDDNQNSALDEFEIDTTEYVCNGLTGEEGVDGQSSFITQTDIAPDESCNAGAIKFDVGFDDNNNDALEEEEIDDSRILCKAVDGVNGLNSLISQSTIFDLQVCPAGGIKFEVGIDDNSNQVLDTGEVDSSEIVCNGVAGGDGLNALVKQTELIVGDADCPFGGIRFDAGIDLNRNGELNGVSGVVGDEITSVDFICEKKNPLSSNARLDGIQLDEGALNQFFQASIYEYSSWVNHLVSSISIRAFSENENAIISINGIEVASGEYSPPLQLAEGLNEISVQVTAENSETINLYSVGIVRQGMQAFVQRAYVKASNTEHSDYFGSSISISGDTMAISSPGEDSNGLGVNSGTESDNSLMQSGAVFIYRRISGTWHQEAYIKASNTGPSDAFGSSVALFGNTLAVGAYGEASSGTGVNSNTQDDNSAPNAGAVYMFERYGSSWVQQAYIKASNTEGSDLFGMSVVLDNDTLAVSALGEDSNGTGINTATQNDNSSLSSGAVYVFSRNAGSWSQQAYIKSRNSEEGDRFGVTLALSNNTLAVSSINEASNGNGVNSGEENDNTAPSAGAVYLYSRIESEWTQDAYVKASNSDENDRFGSSVALLGDTLVVGAYTEAGNGKGVNSGSQLDNSEAGSGAVYVFSRTNGDWGQQAYIKASNTEAGDGFGTSVALSNDYIVVAAHLEASNSSGIPGGYTGQADNSSVGSGAVYVFSKNVNTWEQNAYIKASNTGVNDRFGSHIAASRNTIMVHSHREASNGTGINSQTQSNNDMDYAGAVYIFR